MNHDTNARVWIGLVDLKPKRGSAVLDGAPGAFSNAFALAGSELEYRRLVEQAFRDLELEVEDFDDVELLEHRMQNYAVPDEIVELARTLSGSSPVAHDKLYIYEAE